MAKDAFMKIFWGFLFIFLDIRINGIDFVLPDFVGYILIVFGLAALSGLHPGFRKANAYAKVMVLVSFVDLVEMRRVIGRRGGLTLWRDLLWPLSLLAMILNLIMVWHICRAISELAEASGNRDLADTATLRWKLYFGVAVSSWCIGLLALAESDLARLAVIPAVIFAIVAMVLLMGLMLRASREIRTGLPLPEDYSESV